MITTLITGAGRRLGAAIARHLAAQGHALVLHYHRSETEANALAAELAAAHGTHSTLVQADLAGDLTGFWQTLPPVTNIIHSASLYERDQLATASAASLRAHMAVNYEAPLLLTQGFLAQLPEGATGNAIVLGDGTYGWSIAPEFFSYSASKYIWEATIKLLASACAPRVRANLLALAPTLPGVQDPDGLFERLAARAPLERTSSPEELCQAIDFLLASPGVTGQIISLAGGLGLPTSRPKA